MDARDRLAGGRLDHRAEAYAGLTQPVTGFELRIAIGAHEIGIVDALPDFDQIAEQEVWAIGNALCSLKIGPGKGEAASA